MNHPKYPINWITIILQYVIKKNRGTKNTLPEKPYLCVYTKVDKIRDTPSVIHARKFRSCLTVKGVICMKSDYIFFLKMKWLIGILLIAIIVKKSSQVSTKS